MSRSDLHRDFVVLAVGGIDSLSSVLGTLEMVLNGACSSSGPKSSFATAARISSIPSTCLYSAAVTRAAPVRIVANEFDVAAARLPALPGRAGFDYPVTGCLQHLPFTSVPSFARSLDLGGGHGFVEHP